MRVRAKARVTTRAKGSDEANTTRNPTLYAVGLSLKHSSAMPSTSVKRTSEAAIARRWITPSKESLIDLTRVGPTVGAGARAGAGAGEIDVGAEAGAGMGSVVTVEVEVNSDGGDGGGNGSILKIEVSVV